MHLRGTVVIVTGAAGGIGRALAQRFVELGARLVVTDVQEELLAQTMATLSAMGRAEVAGLAGDCSSESHLRALIDLAEHQFGPVDLFVANAGVARGQGLDAPDEDWFASVEVNVLAHVRAARLLMPRWLERGGATSSVRRRPRDFSRRSGNPRTASPSTRPSRSPNGCR